MPGQMNAGKTTLTAGLLLSGADYLTDELVAIDRRTRLAHAYARPLNIGYGSWPALETLRPEPADQGFSPDRQWHIDPLSIAGTRVATPSAIEHVIAPSYQADGDTRVEPLSKAAAVELLYHQLMNGGDEREGEAFEVLVGVARGARCTRLIYDSLDAAVALVHQQIQD